MLGNIKILVDAPLFTLDMIVNGLLIGAVFALIAYGLALVWGVMNVKNLAQGDFVIFGAYVAWTLFNLGIHPFFGIPVAFFVLWAMGGGLYLFDFENKYFSGMNTNRRLVLFGIFCLAGGILGMLLIGESKYSVFSSVPDTFFKGILIALFLVFVTFGGIYGFVVRHVIERDLFTSLLATFGVAIVM